MGVSTDAQWLLSTTTEQVASFLRRMDAERNAELVRIGQLVAALRRSKGWTQVDLAHHAEIHPSTMTRIETGRHRAEPPNFRKVAEALGVDPALITPVEPNFETQLDRIEDKLDRVLTALGADGPTDASPVDAIDRAREEFRRELDAGDGDDQPDEEPGQDAAGPPAA